MRLTPAEARWALAADARIHDTALALQNIGYMFSQLCMMPLRLTGEAVVDDVMLAVLARSQGQFAAVSLAERLLRGVENW